MSLTRTSSRPCSRSIRSTSARTCSGSRWSVGTAMPVAARRRDQFRRLLDGLGRPADLADLLAGGASRRVDGRPAAPSSTAMARPAPRVAPATSATLPASGVACAHVRASVSVVMTPTVARIPDIFCPPFVSTSKDSAFRRLRVRGARRARTTMLVP